MWRFICRCTAVFIACLLFYTPSAVVAHSNNQATVVATDLINQFRNRHGLASFQTSGQLTAVAQQHADYMAAVAFVDHYDANGNRVDARALNGGYTGRVTELIFGSSGDATRAVGWWQESELHRALLLSQRYTEIGVGAAVNNNDGWTYWVVVLGDGVSQEDAVVETVIDVATEAVVVVDSAVLLPTATPVVLPTLTAIPTVTPFPTAVPTLLIVESPSSPTPIPTIASLSEPQILDAPSITETPFSAEIASSDTSSPSTMPTDIQEPVTDDLLTESSAPPRTEVNLWVIVFTILSILLCPLLIYFWLGYLPASQTGE